MKIAVIGYSGAGKSTLAKTLSDIYGCPLMYLDTVQFLPGWAERPKKDGIAIVDRFMENKDWVIDGNYHSFRQEQRLEQADRIVFMDFPRLTCLRQAYGRYLRNRRRTRESMADGCEEKFDFEFFKWILFDGRDSRHRAHYQNICRVYAGKVTICRNRKDADAFVQRCRKENCTKPDASSVG